MRVFVAGTGYVGLTVGACVAHLGHHVVCYDVDRPRIDRLQVGDVPLYEPGLEAMVARLSPTRLTFVADLPDGPLQTDAVLICVGTPSMEDGSTDMTALHALTAALTQHLPPGQLVITKSTVPPGTNRWLAARLQREGVPARVVANPEFLREGSAVADFLAPDRVVYGVDSAEDARAADRVFAGVPGPRVVTTWEGAELTKYASNAYLAVRVSFVNELARVCAGYGADATEVARATGLDHRIGTAHFAAGLGYGGSCLPKDVAALQHAARAVGAEMAVVGAAARVNDDQVAYVTGLLERALGGLDGRCVTVLGLAFKGGSDDIRDSPALRLANRLLTAGAQIRAHDPLALQATRDVYREAPLRPELFTDPLTAAEGASAVVVATDCPEYRDLDLRDLRGHMAGLLLLDARNVFAPEAATGAGLVYVGVGRGSHVRR